MTRYSAVFAMFIVTSSSRQTVSRQMATRLDQSSSRGELDAHDMTVGARAAKGERPTAKHSQRYVMHGAKASNSEPKFRLQARGSPLRRLSLCSHSRSGVGSGGRVCP